jgi:hypothetical protein
MAVKLTRGDIRHLGKNSYKIGSIEFELMPETKTVDYHNVETEETGTRSIDDIQAEFGDEVAGFFREKLGA